MWYGEKGMGTPVIVGVSYTTLGLRRGDFLALVTSRSIVNVIPGVVCLGMRWCVCGVVWTIVGAVGFVVVVTGHLSG